MTVIAGPSTDALQPLRQALLARAHASAASELAAAEADGQQLLHDAGEQAAALLAAARSRGEAEAAAALAIERTAARRDARRIILQAQRAAYDELRRRARDATRLLLEDPARRQRLARTLRGRLGAAVVLGDQPDGGMVAATATGRRVDASVAGLVERAVAGIDLEQLWSAR